MRARSPSIRSGSKNARGRPYSASVHHDPEGYDPSPAITPILRDPRDGSHHASGAVEIIRQEGGSGRQRGTPRQGFGRSRGSGGKTIHWIVFWTTYHFTTRIHLLVNAPGLPVRTEITAGQTSDCLGFDLVMADNLPIPSVLLADRGHDADSIRKSMGKRDVLSVIPMRRSRKKRVATRYDKTAESFPGFIDITSIRLWVRPLST
jgi:transposase